MMADHEPGPDWNVEAFPASYNGTPIVWDPERYDTVAMPFIVAIKQNFWSWRIRAFTVCTGALNTDVQLPSVAPDGMTMIAFDGSEAGPAVVSEEFVTVVRAMGSVLLDKPWRFRLLFSDGDRSEEFNWNIGG